ncbi:Tetratricopeptide repeat-like superfamily protein [Hibiscus syriacus]|uniref:Tetratricopeptide repeat-like superfamily protein n=1 Tax=Hibiscus syriacus TaxID=106335 RepID=A0A6A3D5W7_HIBSY|nr:Tetratricopeptide repeat-like superfamily protein [Hibiscus syriacus]
MDENSELEEGEACYYRDDDGKINPDTAFSYLDEKIKNVLGHFRKEFEGGVSAETLGAKFGGYGSFLPTYERSPSRLSHQKTPQGNSCIQRSTNNLSMEVAFQNSKAPPSAPLTVGPGNASCSSGNIAAKHDSHLSFNHVAGKPALKDVSFNRDEIPTDQKTLKVRIKVGSDNKFQKNSAIYSGLGLDDSPSSSLGNSPDESGGTVTASPGAKNESPTKILQVMTSFHAPGGLLISPLNDSLLCLLRKEKEGPSRDITTIPMLKGCRGNSSGLIDEYILGNGKEPSEKKTKFLIAKSKKVLESKHGNCVKVENDKKLLIRKKSENKIAGGKESLANDLKHTSLSNSVNVAGAMDASPRVCDISVDANQDGSRGGLFSSDSSKKDYLESISGRNRSSGKKKKQDILLCSVEKAQEQSVLSSDKNASLDLVDYGGSKCNQNTAPLKRKEVSKAKRKCGGIAADSMKESLRLDVGATPKDSTSSSQSLSSGKSKMHKLKLLKDKVRDNHRDAFDANFKQKHEKMDSSTRLVHSRPKEIFSDRTVDNQLLGVDAPGVVHHLTDKTLASQTTALTAAAPVLIEENWVQCDRCHKWRLLPFDTRPEQLPENWLCSMLNWLPGMNRCNISEDETTKALNALYQIPVAENQNNPTLSAHLQHLDQKNSSFNSQVSSIQSKNRGTKEVCKVSKGGLSQMSKTKMNQQQESLKNRSLKNMTQVPVESNLTDKTSFQQNEKNPVAGVTKQAQMKNKRESGLYPNEGSKKAKTEAVYTTDKHQSSNQDIRTVSLNTSTALPTQANGKRVQNYNEYFNSGNVKRDLKERSVVSVKKVVDQTRASSDGMPLDMKRNGKMAPVKKRKLDDREDCQNGHKLYMKEESSESGFWNGKKSRASKIEGKQSLRNDGNGTLNWKRMDPLIGGTEEVRSIDRNQQLRKHKEKSSSQITLDGLDSLRRDSETGLISKAAMSSSSKVSGSHKTRVNFEEARGSPVESVSSSPMRTSYPGKFALNKGEEHSGKNADANTSITPSGNSGRCWDGEGIVELVQSVPEMKEKVSSDFNPKSHKYSTVDCQNRDSVCKISIKTKTSRLGISHLGNGATRFAENGQHALERPHGEDRVNRDCQVNAFSQESDKGSPIKNSESSAADKMKVDPAYQWEDLFSRKNMKYQSHVGPNGHGCLQETVADCKLNLPKPNKDENYVERRDPSGHWSSGSRKEARLNKKHDVDSKSAASCSKKGKTAPEKNLIRDIDGQTKVMQVETRSGFSKSSLHCKVESQQEIKGHLTAPEAEQGVVSDGYSVNGSCNVDSSEAIKLLGKAGSKNGSNHSSGKHIADLHMAHRPLRENSTNQTANNALNDAEKLRNYADRLKSSGFALESNEIYFKAALKFLGVAACLESNNSESGRHGDTNHMQIYSTAIELCEMCAQEFEKSGEMIAAALAYKCMEVAYMRVVYCKDSTSCRDRNELQATLQMVPQGESPSSRSSSVSDVDNNLNNQQTVEKAPLAKGLVSHVGGAHVIVVRNRSFVRLLDFTQAMIFAMGATRKSQNAFTAAKASLEKTHNPEWIISVRKVMHFNFQDVEGFICLVQQATEAISRSGLGGARE